LIKCKDRYDNMAWDGDVWSGWPPCVRGLLLQSLERLKMCELSRYVAVSVPRKHRTFIPVSTCARSTTRVHTQDTPPREQRAWSCTKIIIVLFMSFLLCRFWIIVLLKLLMLVMLCRGHLTVVRTGFILLDVGLFRLWVYVYPLWYVLQHFPNK